MSLAQYKATTIVTGGNIFGSINDRLNTQFSVSLKLSHLLFILLTATLATAYVIRYRVSRTYSRLSKELDNNEDDDQSIAADMWNESNDSDSESPSNEKPASSHFDEFLKAIKVFGFLEHDVFNELTKSTQTLRVQTNECIKLQNLGGFAVVISGAMKVYCKSTDCNGNEMEDPTTGSDPFKGYDLLNEITVSAPISSLSSILSLFSDSIESDAPPSEFDKVNATVLAVASEPSTIVVIPAEAFRDLTTKFPQAAANIVQVILFRWSQITVRTCQSYLNLTQHFYGTEQILNKSAKNRIDHWLPKALCDNVVKKMKQLGEESQKNMYELRSCSSKQASAMERLKSFGFSNPRVPTTGAGAGDRSRTAQFGSERINPESSSESLSAESRNAEKRKSDFLNSESHKPGSVNSEKLSEKLGSDGFNSERLNFERFGSGRHDSFEYPFDPFSYSAYNSDHRPGESLSASMLNMSDSTPKVPNCSYPVRDSEESALRRAIVETMFTTIMLDSPFTFTINQDGTPVPPPVPVATGNATTNAPASASADARASASAGASARARAATGPEPTDSGKRYSPSVLSSARNNSFMLTRRSIHHDSTNDSDNGAPSSFGIDSDTPPHSYSDVLNDASEVIELLWYKKGQYVSKYGEKCCGLIYVLDGLLEVGYHSLSSEKSYQKLYDVESGHITGFLETISSYSSFVDLVAKEDSCVAIISKSYFERLAETYPLLYITAAKALTTSLTRPIVQLDFALEWVSIKSGGKLISEGQNANAIYFVLNGRVRVFNNKTIIGDYGQGSTIGELETMSGEKYSGSVIAVRDTELSRFPKTLVECLARQHPSVTFEMSRMVVQAMRLRNSHISGELNSSDFKTLAILRTSVGLPVEEFAVKLSSAFSDLGKVVTVLTHSVVMRYLGKYAFHKMGALRLKAYLADLEEKNDIILYVADGESSSQWSRTCIHQADCVLLLADGSGPSVFSEVEKMVVKSPTKSRAHLILLHNDKVVSHGSTAKWLKHRPWISAHYHIQMPFIRENISPHHPDESQSRVQRKFKQIKNRVQDELRVLQQKKAAKHEKMSDDMSEHLKYKNDFNRLARVLAGEAVGLVLGGGGARGLSHIGVLQALEEAGVPIDLVGGTSIGSLIGGLYAKEYDIVPLMRKSKQFSVRMSSFWRLLLDMTYPMTAWTTGHAFNSAVWKCLGDSRIEDFWVRFFTNTTNLSDSKMEVHERGYSWRFIRASMSLAGLLPPLEEKGKMLLDGGYVDNLPVTEMKKMGARYIIAVDVGAVDDTTLINYGDTLSGFGALVNKFNPFSSTPNVPNIAEIQQRLTYVSSVKALEEAKVADGVIYLRPPIDNYATLDFSKFDEIREVGFEYGNKVIKQRIASGELPTTRAVTTRESTPTGFMKYRRYSF